MIVTFLGEQIDIQPFAVLLILSLIWILLNAIALRLIKKNRRKDTVVVLLSFCLAIASSAVFLALFNIDWENIGSFQGSSFPWHSNPSTLGFIVLAIPGVLGFFSNLVSLMRTIEMNEE